VGVLGAMFALDAKLARATKWVGAIFLILTLVLLILQG
jgi:preprotein translocase subunit SecG